MKARSRERGFTIVEVMIVLAITGLLFLSAVLLVNGRQNQAAFDISIRDVQSRIQQTISEVSTGYYPNLGNFTCAPNGSGISVTSGAAAQGSNSGCVFLGKAMQFGLVNTNPEQYVVFPIAGLQQSGGQEVTDLASAAPIVLAPGTGTNSGVPDEAIAQSLQNGLTVYSMNYVNGSAQPIGGFAVVSSLAQYNGSALLSGSQQVSLVPITGTQLHVSAKAMADEIDANLAGSANLANPSGGVQICFASGTTNQSGLITVGGNSRALSVTLSIRSNRTCA